MAKTSEIVAGIALAAVVTVGAGFAMKPGPADAGYGVAATPVTVSNTAAKSDMIEAPKEPAKAVEVANVRVVGDDFILSDGRGNVVYRSQRAAQTTSVAKNTDVPLVTGYGVAVNRVEQAFALTAN